MLGFFKGLFLFNYISSYIYFAQIWPKFCVGRHMTPENAKLYTSKIFVEMKYISILKCSVIEKKKKTVFIKVCENRNPTPFN